MANLISRLLGLGNLGWWSLR